MVKKVLPLAVAFWMVVALVYASSYAVSVERSRDFWQCRYAQVVATSNAPTDCGVER